MNEFKLIFLLILAKKGQRGALEMLFTDYVYPRFYNIFFKHEFNKCNVDDLVQEANIRFIATLPNIRAISKGEFDKLLNDIARSTLVDYIRKIKSEIDTDSFDADKVSTKYIVTNEDILKTLLHQDILAQALEIFAKRFSKCTSLISNMVLLPLSDKELAKLEKLAYESYRNKKSNCRKEFESILHKLQSDN